MPPSFLKIIQIGKKICKKIFHHLRKSTRIKLIFYLKMKSINRETLKIRLYSYYKKYKHLGKNFTIDRFFSEEGKRTTIYDIINRFESGKNAKRQSAGGRNRLNKLKRLGNNKDGVAQRILAGRCQCTQSYVNRVLRVWEYKNTRNERF